VRGHPTEGSSRSIGLGLFIVKAISQAHGGTVQVTSSTSEGTTFTFAFSLS
jgi:sigma-B regulation protein RsbU (phosphoserine phosphatase)